MDKINASLSSIRRVSIFFVWHCDQYIDCISIKWIIHYATFFSLIDTNKSNIDSFFFLIILARIMLFVIMEIQWIHPITVRSHCFIYHRNIYKLIIFALIGLHFVYFNGFFFTVSPESVVIPIVSCIFGFPILALLVICCLRHRAKMARERDRRRNYDIQDHTVSLVRFSPIHRLSESTTTSIYWFTHVETHRLKLIACIYTDFEYPSGNNVSFDCLVAANRAQRAVSLRTDRSLSRGFPSLDLDTVLEERSDQEQTQVKWPRFRPLNQTPKKKSRKNLWSPGFIESLRTCNLKHSFLSISQT